MTNINHSLGNLTRYLPNLLTIIRVIMIPFIILSFYIDSAKISGRLGGLLFFLAGLTDFADGILARRYKLQTRFGKMLDPIADKLLIICSLAVLLHFNKAAIIPTLIIIIREIFISGLREFLGASNINLTVTSLSKTKTMVQMFAIFLLILGSNGTGISYTEEAGNFTLWAAALLTLYTGFLYYKASLKYLKEE